MIAAMMRATGVLLILAGCGLCRATPANEGMRCIHLSSARDADLAIGTCTAAIKSGGLPDAGLAVVLGRRCVAYAAKHDYARALPDCERAVELAPKSGLAVFRRGTIRFLTGDLDGALLDCERAIRLDPNIAEAYRGRASVYNRRRQYDRAIQDYGDALRLKPDAATYYRRGWSYFQKRYYDSAKQDFDEAIRLGSGASTYYYRGWCYFYTGDYGRAIADFDEAIRLNPNVASAYRSRASIHNRLREYDLAIRDYTQALRLAPDAGSYNGRGRAYFHKGANLLALGDFARASWRVSVPLVLVAGLIYVLWRRRKRPDDGDEPPAAEESVPVPEPLHADTDLDVLIRTSMRDRVAIGLMENLFREAGVPFFVMDQNTAARQESGNMFGWWAVRVPHEREAEAREIIRAVEEMKLAD